MSAAELSSWVVDARERTCALFEDLEAEQLLGPKLAIVNPPLWEFGHVAYFQEKWVLRHVLGRPPLYPEVDSLYDSSAIPHDTRWDLPLFDRTGVLEYLRQTRDAVCDVLARNEPDERLTYFVKLAVFHEDMHGEAFVYTRQTLGYRAPSFIRPKATESIRPHRPSLGDAEIPGGTFLLGADPSEPFVFDNEKWAHPVEVKPFRMAKAAVTQGELAEFVGDGGYTRRELWSDAGWAWRRSANAEHPVYWRREGTGWLRRDFDRWVPLEPNRPVLHVNAYEAEAYCRWAGRRLPTEAEWELAAAGLGPKRRFPWGDAPPEPSKANLDARSPGTVEVDALADGDGPFGCRQLLGNVWEWTADAFGPYPGFVADPYEDYSMPWFHTHRVLRGGCFLTRGRLLRNTWRNFYTPDRRDVWAGFRTCALD